ncbi:MAG TPA: YciI family protein [Nitrospira sp.]|nr:YciI family protein [Nitrospira sp.]
MKYMLLIYREEKAERSEKEREDCKHEAVKLAEQLRSQGQYVAANPLHPTTMATSVRVRDGKRLVTDGPFAETHEQLGGYFLIEAKNREEAIAVAFEIPMASWGTVEIRPVSSFHEKRLPAHATHAVAEGRVSRQDPVAVD